MMPFARAVGWLLVILAAAPGFAPPIEHLIAAEKKEALLRSAFYAVRPEKHR
jgi:hypothetical protein